MFPCCLLNQLDVASYSRPITSHPSQDLNFSSPPTSSSRISTNLTPLIVLRISLQADIMQLRLTNDNMQWRKSRT